MRLIILGGTGSGKGTQTAKLGDRLQIPSIATGDILREDIASATELGQEAKTYVEQGELVPDRLMIQLIQQRLQQPDVAQGWILEGYPRTAFQAEELDFLLKKIKQQLDWAVYLQVSEEVMTQRALARCFDDDQPAIIERRLQNFRASTIPILEYYEYRHKLLTINGEQPSEAVAQEIIKQLSNQVIE